MSFLFCFFVLFGGGGEGGNLSGERGGGGGMEVGEREIIYLSLHCHHQNDSGTEMGSDESRFNVSLIVRDKVTIKTASTDHKF